MIDGNNQNNAHTDVEIEEKITYKALKNEKNYLKLLISSATSRFGDGVDSIAFSWLVYTITGSTLSIALFFAINSIPNLIFGMISGTVSNYFPKNKIMAICDTGRFLCVSLICFLFITNRIELWSLLTVTFLNSSFESFRAPASTSILPLILPKKKLDRGIALSSSSDKFLELIGIATSPVIISIFGIGGALFVDAITFLICAIIIFTLKFKEELKDRKSMSFKNNLLDLKEGFKYTLNNKFIFNLCIFGAIINALIVPLNVFQAPYVTEVLNRGVEALPFISVPLSIAMIVSALFVPKLKEKIGAKKLFIFSGVIIGFTYFNMSFLGDVPRWATYLLLSINTFIMGAGIMGLNIPVQIAVVKATDQVFLPRVVAILSTLLLCSVPLTSCVVGLLSKVISIKTLFLIFGAIFCLVFILQFKNKNMKQFDLY